MHATRFAEVKTDCPKLYNPADWLCGSQNRLSEGLYGCYKLCGSQSVLSKLLQASYTLRGCQNQLSTTLEAYYTRCGSQNGLSEDLQGCLGFAEVKTDSPNSLRLKRTPWSSTRLLTALRKSKPTLWTSTRQLLALLKSKGTLQSSTRLLHALRKSNPTFRSSTRLLTALWKSKWTLRSSRLLHALRKLNGLSEVLQGCRRFAEVKKHSLNFYKAATGFPEVKTNSLKL